MHNFDQYQFFKFIAVGLLNTLVGYSIFALFIQLGILPYVSLLFATVLGVIFNFATTGRLVFHNRNIQLFGRFAAVYGFIYFINLLMLKLILAQGLSTIPAQGICLFATVPLSFILQKLFVFKEMANEDH